MRKFGRKKIRQLIEEKLATAGAELAARTERRRRKCEYVKEYQKAKKERRVYTTDRIRRIDGSIL